jgi:nucleotide-binding universal stress UspA family protein
VPALERVVVGVDLDPGRHGATRGSLAAVETALWLARPERTHVTLVHSAVRDEYFDPLSREMVALGGEGARSADSRAAIGELLERFRGRGVACETVDTADRPSRALLREAARQRSDLVVIGKHDDREVDAARVGPTASMLVRDCPCAVWTALPSLRVEPRVVLAATDLTATGAAVVGWAAEVAERARAELHLVHVHPRNLRARSTAPGPRGERIAAALRAELEGPLAGEARIHVREADAAHGILDVAADVRPDLVVFGARSHARADGAQLGQTAERLLGRVRSALLVVRPVMPLAAA